MAKISNTDTDSPARRVQPGQPERIDADHDEIPGDMPLQDFPAALEPGWGPASWFRLALVLFAFLIGFLAIMRWVGG